MKRPAFMFYPGDWQRDSALRACSVGARGLWIEMLCVQHQAEPYGYLVLNGMPIAEAQLARLVGAKSREVVKWLAELEACGVYSKDDQGRIFSRRMVRDEQTRNNRAAGGELGAEHGIKGAEHGVKGGRPRKETGDKKPPLEPSPSVAVAVSVSASKEKPSAKAGAEAPRSPKDFLFHDALEALKAQGVAEEQGRSLIGRLIKHRGEAQAAADAHQAIADGRVSLRDWLGRVIAGPSKRQAPDGDLSKFDYSAGLPMRAVAA